MTDGGSRSGSTPATSWITLGNLLPPKDFFSILRGIYLFYECVIGYVYHMPPGSRGVMGSGEPPGMGT